MRTAFHLTAGLLAVSAAASAQAAETAQCLTRADLQGIIGYMGPPALESMKSACTKKLGNGAFLSPASLAMIDELKQGKDTAWPAAKAAFPKLSAKDSDAMMKLPDDTLRLVLDGVFSNVMLGSIEGKVTTSDCRDFGRIIDKLAPLKAASTVDLISEIAMVALRKHKKTPTCSDS